MRRTAVLLACLVTVPAFAGTANELVSNVARDYPLTYVPAPAPVVPQVRALHPAVPTGAIALGSIAALAAAPATGIVAAVAIGGALGAMAAQDEASKEAVALEEARAEELKRLDAVLKAKRPTVEPKPQALPPAVPTVRVLN